MSEPVENWDAIVHKGVRTKDRHELGNVVEVDADKLITIQGVVKEKEYSPFRCPCGIATWSMRTIVD